MSTFRQTREIVWMNLRSIPARIGASLVIVVGIAGVVAVLVAMQAMGFTNVVSLAGGFDAWVAEQRPIAKPREMSFE